MTANAVNGTKEMFMEYGFNDYISKPIERKKLEVIIKNYVPKELIIKKETGVKKLSDDDIIEIEGIDVRKGLLICNNEIDQYIEILKLIADEGLRKIKRLKEFFEQERFHDYVIEVHGLKSVASNIGAVKLAELAKEHEMSGKNKSFNYIYENFQYLIYEYEHIIDGISKSLTNEVVEEDRLEYVGEKINIIKSELEEKIENIIYLLEDFEYDDALLVLKELFHYNISNDTKEVLFKVKDLLNNLEYEEGANLLKNILINTI